MKTEQKPTNGLFHPDRDRTDDGKRATWMIVLGIILLVVGFALLWQASLVTLGCAGEIFTMIGFIVGGALAGAGGVVLMVFGIILLSLKARYAPNSK